jgi:hypothetical protein
MSLVWLHADRRGNYQMAPLVSHHVDDVGVQKLDASSRRAQGDAKA